MKKALKLLLLLMTILGVASLAFHAGSWDGAAIRPLKVTVRNDAGKAIEGATVSLIQDLDAGIRKVDEEEFSKHLVQSKRRFHSDTAGSGVLQGMFRAGGGDGLFGQTGRFVVEGNLIVTHRDYLDISLPLANFTGKQKISLRKKELEFTVFMEKRKTELSGAGQPATPSVSKLAGTEYPKASSEGCPQ